MPYKIVQSKENGCDFLCVVPSRWEQNGFVKWPAKDCDAKTRSLYKKLMMDGDSAPPDNWIPVKCRLKREFETHAEAQTEWKCMSDKSDTEASDSMPPPKTNKIPIKRHVKNREHIGRDKAHDYAAIFTDLNSKTTENTNSNDQIQNSSSTSVIGSSSIISAPTSSSSSLSSLNINVLENIVITDGISNLNSDNQTGQTNNDEQECILLDGQFVTPEQLTQIGCVKTIDGDGNDVWQMPPHINSENENAIDDTAATTTTTTNDHTNNMILSLLHSLSYRVSKMEAQQKTRLDKMELDIQSILKILSTDGGSGIKANSNDEVVHAVEQSFGKIKTVDDVKLFDCKLADETYFNKMVSQLKLTCIADLSLSATDIGYILSDELFERDVFLHFSYTGQTKDKTKPKAAFKQFANIHTLFLHVIRMKLPEYAVATLELFFSKKIISNAKDRANQKGLRAPRQKSRKRINNNSFVTAAVDEPNDEKIDDLHTDAQQDSNNNVDVQPVADVKAAAQEEKAQPLCIFSKKRKVSETKKRPHVKSAAYYKMYPFQDDSSDDDQDGNGEQEGWQESDLTDNE